MDGDLLDRAYCSDHLAACACGDEQPSPVQHKESPEEILKRRYASGEISPDEYQRMLN